jgi:hypothetical protein
MFAGLPGIGVGTLFYVLIGLWMPLRELPRLVRGTSSVARWRLILKQLTFSVSIIFSIMMAEAVLMWVLGQSGPGSLNPARLLNNELSSRAPQSILAAPITASLLLLGFVLFVVEAMRVIVSGRHERRRRIHVQAGTAAGDPGELRRAS